MKRLILLGLASSLAMPAFAHGLLQTEPLEKPSERNNPDTCANATMRQGKDVDTKKQPAKDKTLSEKLAASNGVICPPPIDPAMKQPTPPGGSMPVIPPPGSPGGDPNIQPK